ncbi:MAG: PIN domain-containing protein [Nocardioides sp.]
MARRLVLDANILVRAVLGKRVKDILATHAVTAECFAPEVAYDDAERHLPEILTKRGRADAIGDSLAFLGQLRESVLAVPEEVYLDHKAVALARIEQRDPDDWPILATALALECPIWTEDNDFFGAGVPTWTTDRVEIYLSSAD